MRLFLSRYSFTFYRHGKYLLYNSINNVFYEINQPLYEYLTQEVITSESDDNHTIQQLINEHILVHSASEDDAYYDAAKGQFLISSFNTSHIGLTIAPTVRCNLKCPYCFEENKPAGTMSENTINNLIKFIRDHKCASTYSIAWFGGEPLLSPNIIQSILVKTKDIEHLKLTHHSIVTNGTLINDEVINLFIEYPLTDIRITLDGNRTHHNEKRFTTTGQGTFDLILNNIDKSIYKWDNTKFSIRINIDKSNMNDYCEMRDMIKQRYSNCNNISIYPGILRANKGCESEVFFSSKDHVEFNRMLNDGSTTGRRYPSHCSKGCTATNASSYVIGPKGEIYLCWEHIGMQEKIVGNIDQPALSNPTLFYRFLTHGSLFDDIQCKQCGLLPICNGGCPNKRIENIFEKTNHNLCALYNENDKDILYDTLYDYFLSKL